MVCLKERLHKVLARRGYGSRRKCEQRILAGEVHVDGDRITTLGVSVDPDRQVIRCAGQQAKPEQHVVFLLNKPRGVVCTTSDERGRKTVLDLVRTRGRLYPAGRLDADSQGMVILTNDGDLCERITHPRHGVGKTYHVVVRGSVAAEVITKMQRGIWLSEGRATPAKLRVVRRDRERTIVEITLREGKKREVHRLFSRFGFKVRRLKRIRIGALTLGKLAEGEFRTLGPGDVAKLFRKRKA